MAFPDEDADHGHGHVLDQHRRTKRIGKLAKQLLHHRLAENCHRRSGAMVLFGETASRQDRPAPDLEIAGRDALDASTPILAAVDELGALSADITHVGYGGVLFKYSLDVACSQTGSTAVARAHAVHARATRDNHKQIRAEALNLWFDRRRGALAYCDHGDERGDADED